MSKPKDHIPHVQSTPRAELLIVHEEATGIPADVLEAIEALPVPIPAQVQIGDCLGKMVQCPLCGKPAYVDHARGARTATQVISSKWWVLVKCKGYCGSMLSKINTMVTPEAEPEPEVVTRTLGEAVGKFILCPRESCRARAQAAWTLDEGHVVTCGQCQTRPYPGTTVVEIVA
jgi:hypothetical protein